MSSKRPRSSSPSSSHSSTSPYRSPSSKILKVIPDVLYTSRTCTLPPTCSYPGKATPLSSAHEVEEHYAKYHTHVCEHDRCMSVFPDARFLELHFAECHDPITALKKERGEKVFACYFATCPRLFMTPKGRRLHLIQSHGYPKQFFFAVTNKGIGGLLHKWGQGASLYRGDWKSRVQERDMNSASENVDDNRSESGSEMDVENHGAHKINGKQKPMGGGDGIVDNITENPAISRTLHSTSSARPLAYGSSGSPESDGLAIAMSSLTLVPDKIRFGRGGKKGGFAHWRPAKPTTQTGRGLPSETAPDTIIENLGDQKCFKGRGGRRRTPQGKACEGTSMDRDPDAATLI